MRRTFFISILIQQQRPPAFAERLRVLKTCAAYILSAYLCPIFTDFYAGTGKLLHRVLS